MAEESAYAGCAPAELWRHFAALNRIPRRSGREAGAREYVRSVAEAAGARCRADAFGNLVVSAAATPGREGAPGTAIQAHLDMVCEKRPEVVHDFDRDPIVPRRVGDRIYASGTTLGADNGIGAAAALAVLTTPGLAHGPLELAFTIEEEVGLRGATALDPALLSAAYLINLDTEEPDELIIGCAGGARTTVSLPLALEFPPQELEAYRITVSGLQGGHSGLEIHQPRANAIRVLVQVLAALRDAGLAYQLVALAGGNAPNAIPRDAVAMVAVAPQATPGLRGAVAQLRAALKTGWAEDEPGVELELDAAPVLGPAIANSEPVLRLLWDLPHGVLQMSEAFPDKVETSSNLAQVATNAGTLEIALSSRSFVEAGLDGVLEQIRRAAMDAGATVETGSRYPAWEPQQNTRLQEITRAAFEAVTGAPPRVEVVHAGLECGVIVAKVPGMEAVSFGPRIRGAHTPEEYVDVPTVLPTWNLLTSLLSTLSEPASNAGGDDGRE